MQDATLFWCFLQPPCSWHKLPGGEVCSSPVHPATAVVQPQGGVFMPACNDHARDMVTGHSEACPHLRPGFLAATALQLPVPAVSRALQRARKLKWVLWKISITLQSALGSWLGCGTLPPPSDRRKEEERRACSRRHLCNCPAICILPLDLRQLYPPPWRS